MVQGRAAVLEVGISDYIGKELKMELAGFTDGKNVGVRKREIQDHTHVLDFEILGRCWCHLVRQGKLEKSRILGVNKWEIRKSVSYMLLLHMAFYTFFSPILSLLFQLYQKRSKRCWQIDISHGFSARC